MATKPKSTKYPGQGGTQPIVKGGTTSGGKTNEGMLQRGRNLEKLRANGKSL